MHALESGDDLTLPTLPVLLSQFSLSNGVLCAKIQILMKMLLSLSSPLVL